MSGKARRKLRKRLCLNLYIDSSLVRQSDIHSLATVDRGGTQWPPTVPQWPSRWSTVAIGWPSGPPQYNVVSSAPILTE